MGDQNRFQIIVPEIAVEVAKLKVQSLHFVTKSLSDQEVHKLVDRSFR
jgi:hypothetical protein